jgi:hypothetical protein
MDTSQAPKKKKIIKKKVEENVKTNQSQKHGFVFENEVRTKVFDLPSQGNDRNIHDIHHSKNKFDSNENISIKTLGSNTICCGDIERFYNYNFSCKNTMIIVKYTQNNEKKIIQHIYEIDYNEECHKLLFGNLPESVIKSYVASVKSIPKKTKGKKAKKIFNYLEEKKKLKTNYNHCIQINPKVDSSQSRVQCSITNFETSLKDFITYKSSKETPNIIRGKEIIISINSCKRKRNKKSK